LQCSRGLLSEFEGPYIYGKKKRGKGKRITEGKGKDNVEERGRKTENKGGENEKGRTGSERKERRKLENKKGVRVGRTVAPPGAQERSMPLVSSTKNSVGSSRASAAASVTEAAESEP